MTYDRETLQPLGRVETSWFAATDVVRRGSMAFAALPAWGDDGGIGLVDVSDPLSPRVTQERLVSREWIWPLRMKMSDRAMVTANLDEEWGGNPLLHWWDVADPLAPRLQSADLTVGFDDLMPAASDLVIADGLVFSLTGTGVWLTYAGDPDRLATRRLRMMFQVGSTIGALEWIEPWLFVTDGLEAHEEAPGVTIRAMRLEIAKH